MGKEQILVSQEALFFGAEPDEIIEDICNAVSDIGNLLPSADAPAPCPALPAPPSSSQRAKHTNLCHTKAAFKLCSQKTGADAIDGLEGGICAGSVTAR